MWDRDLETGEVLAYHGLTKDPTSIVTWLDMETRTGNDLFDFSGQGRAGIATGSVVEGRSGFARKFSGPSDGVDVANTATSSLSFSSGVTVDAYVLLSSYPATDAVLVARKGSFYLNVSSDGSGRLSLHGTTASAATPLPLPLSRWVRITATATSSALTVYLDGAVAATAAGASIPSSTSAVTIGYASGCARLAGSVDQVLVLKTVPAWSLADLQVRGIRLDPNATDTDFDGLADGQELFVKVAKTPKRYPTKDQSSAYTDKLDLSLTAPTWAIKSVDAMVGFTHGDMGQLAAYLYRSSGASYDRYLTLRSYGNAGEANNFTSYDLLNQGLVPSELTSGGVWYLQAWDDMADLKKGQVEYMQLQLTIRTYPNRADTDSDGLNDSEELNLMAAGSATDPWKGRCLRGSFANEGYFGRDA